MRIIISGAGPAGLYAGIALRQARPDVEVTIYEQNSAAATFGFGVVFSDQALAFLAEDDPQTVALVEPHMQRWNDIAVVHKRQRIIIDGVGFAAIGRLELLGLLQSRAAKLGVEPIYNSRLERLPDADLIIGADGLNSWVRNSAAQGFGAQLGKLQNRFIWYGASREFDALTQTFIETPMGRFNAHHYRYGPGRSTFIIEATDAVWRAAGFAEMDDEQCRAVCEELFADTLEGAPLISNKSEWRQFPQLWCERFHHENRVLVGDALHTAHFSIGSGTRLALEDVAALVGALKQNDWKVSQALPAYQLAREEALRKIVSAACASANWYEQFDRHMELEPWPFALSYIGRAGRMGADKLRRFAPGFARQLEANGVSLSI